MAGRTYPADWGDIPNIIADQAKAFFGTMMFYVPSSDEAYEAALQQFQEQFLYHFYQREIGAETIGQFKLWLRSKFITIMPYYEQLYKTTLIKYNITDTVDMYREINSEDNRSKSDNSSDNLRHNTTDATTNENSTSSRVNDKSDTTGGNVNRFSSTPQNGLTDLRDGRYLTNATIEDRTEGIKSETNSTGKSNGNTTVKRTGNDERIIAATENERKNGRSQEHWHGKEGGVTYAELIKQAREAIININKMIIDECEPLFMQVF